MNLPSVWDFFKEALFLPSPQDETLFNPYRDNNPAQDLPNGAQIRRHNLHNYLASFQAPPRVLIIGEAPGWRGCRFSGVPFTSEYLLVRGELPFSGRQSSRRASPHTEATATIFWETLRGHHAHFLAWNCLPFHPFEDGNPRSNRTPAAGEIKRHQEILAGLINLLRAIQVVALGRSAERALQDLEIPCLYVRHPSHGGKTEFQRGMTALFGSGSHEAHTR
jgi:uracil-DNA glycosylase